MPTALPVPAADIEVGNFHCYDDRRWQNIATRNTDGDIILRRESGPEGEHVEHWKLVDEAQNYWLLHGKSWSPELLEEWVDGELITSFNVTAEFRMRLVAGDQIITDLAEVNA